MTCQLAGNVVTVDVILARSQRLLDSRNAMHIDIVGITAGNFLCRFADMDAGHRAAAGFLAIHRSGRRFRCATFFDPGGGQNMPVLSRLLNLFVTLLFLSFNGHLWLIAIVVQSFERLPIDDAPLLRDGFYALVEHAGIIFSYGLMLGLPVVTLLLAINLALGLLNRLTPQLSIFVIGFPLTLTVGMLSLSMLMRTLTPFLENLLRLLFDGLDEMLMMFI